MGIWKWIGLAYLTLTLVFMVVMFLVLLAEDLKMDREPWRRNSAKFGYNFRKNSAGKYGMGPWFMLACLPIVNLIVITLFLFVMAASASANRRMKRE